MSTFEGEELADEGIARATDASPALSLKLALDVILHLALTREFFDADDVHEYLSDHDLPNLKNSGAWGGLYRQAMGEGREWIEPVTDTLRWRKSARPSLHGKPTQLYHSLVCGDF